VDDSTLCWPLYFACRLLPCYKLLAGRGFTDCDKAKALFVKSYRSADQEERISLLVEATELCPGYIRPYELVGHHYFKTGDNAKAVGYLRKAAELGSGNHKLYHVLAEALFRQQDWMRPIGIW